MIRSDGYDPHNNGANDWERGVDPFGVSEDCYDEGKTTKNLTREEVKRAEKILKDQLKEEQQRKEYVNHEELKEKINNFLWQILPGYITINLAEEVSLDIYQTIMRKIYND